MAKRGRPRVIDDGVRELLVGLVGMGCSRKQAARHVGVGFSTLFAAIKADESFAARLRRAEMQQDITPLRRILDHSQKSWRAAAWILERQNPNRYARRPPRMVSSTDCMSFLKSVLDYLLSGASSEDHQRTAHYLKRLEELLGLRDASTPRGRRVVQQMAAAEEEYRTAKQYRTAPRGPINPGIRAPKRKNAAFEQGGGI